MKKLLTVRVSKRRWYRGMGPNKSKLHLPKSHQQCCIGFLARTLDATVKDINGKFSLYDVDTTACQKFECANGWVLMDAYEVNDDRDISDSERIAKLKKLGKKMHVKFVFVP